jgi:hypothetical protein
MLNSGKKNCATKKKYFSIHNSRSNEAIALYRKLNMELELLTLDPEKAFDTVNHDIMFSKLYQDGVLQFFQDLVLQDLVLCCTVQHQSWLAFQYLAQAEQYHLHMLGRQHLGLQMLPLVCEKAFDTVNHDIMFNKLYQNGVEGDMWSLMNNMYKGMTFKVFFSCSSSLSFIIDSNILKNVLVTTIPL